MVRVCQAFISVFASSVAYLLAPAAMFADPPAADPAPTSVSVHIAAWSPRPFADVALAAPDLAACFQSSPGVWLTAEAPPAPLDQAAISAALSAQLRGLVAPGALPELTVTVAAAERSAPDAVAHGSAAVVLVPKKEATGPTEVARTAAPVVLAATFGRPGPDARCGEPLLAVAEALADAGSLALSALPSTLRPVRDWLERKDAEEALAAFAAEALDTETRWPSRRAGLARLRQVGGATPQLGAAAAYLVEAFGDAAAARRRPFDFLLAWQNGGKAYPAMPRAVRNALAKPLEAGIPKLKEKNPGTREDRDEVARDARARLVATGGATVADVAPTASLAVRLEVAARLRAAGEPRLCEWLTTGDLPRLRTGCRGEGEEGGVVAARPRDDGFEVVWMLPGGDEGVLLVWPRWVLFPAVAPASGELWFLDPRGVWRVALDGKTPPRLAAAGAFRHLALAPDGGAVACARWPDGPVIAVQEAGVRELGVNGRNGIAWLGADTLVASDGETLSLVSLQGERRAGVCPLPCCRTLAATPAGLVAGVSSPCETAVVRVALTERSTTTLFKLPAAPLGIVPLPGGGFALGVAEGVLRWRGDGAGDRIGSGLTPGPG